MEKYHRACYAYYEYAEKAFQLGVRINDCLLCGKLGRPLSRHDFCPPSDVLFVLLRLKNLMGSFQDRF